MRAQRTRHSRHEGCRGQALVEFAIAIPILLLLLFGAIEIGFMIKTKLMMQDAVRAAAHYGSQAGVMDGPSGTTAPGCLSDYAILDDIRSRFQNGNGQDDTLIDTSRVRSIFIYAAADQGNDPRLAPNSTYLPATGAYPGSYPHTGALNGDYYFSSYDTGNGKNVDTSGVVNTGTGEGAVYKLFHGNINGIFATTVLTSTYPATVPDCGSTLNPVNSGGAACFPYRDNTSSGTVDASCLLDKHLGNWPPVSRNNINEKDTGTNSPWPDVFGVDIVYDYQFHTPLFQVISNLFLGSAHTFRMDEHAVFVMAPPVVG